MSWPRRLQLAAIVVFVASYAGLSHYGNTVAKTRDLALCLALAPVLSVALVLLWRWTRPFAALLTAAAAAVVLGRYWPVLKENFSVVYLLQEGGFYSLMAVSFGRSLFGNRAALCTQLADKLHGPLAPREVFYTRR